jgi:hypothetical protein
MAEPQKSLLDENQARVARKILERAPQYGINPDFALGIAMAENMFGDKTSPKGAIGPMQLMPETAKGHNVDPYDEDDNIKGGFLNIKELVGDKRVGLDPLRILAGYHSGPDLKFFKTNDPADLGINALTYIDRVSTFTGGKLPPVLYTEEMKDNPSTEQPPIGSGTVNVSEEDMAKQMAQKRLEGMQLLGAGAGAAAGMGLDVAGRGISRGVNAAADAVARAMESRTPPAGPLGAPGAPGAPPSGGLPARVEPPMSGPSAQSTRILQGGQGDTLGTTGRARQEGYNIETAQRAANKGEAGKLSPQARQVLANVPGLTSTESGVLYPRTEPRQTAGPRPQPSALRVRGGVPYTPMAPDLGSVRPGPNPALGGQVEPTMGAPRPAPAGGLPPGAPPQGPSMASRAMDVGRRVMNAPMVGSGLGGALGGYGAVTMADDANQRMQKKDYLGAAVSGLGALGSAAAVIPHPVPRIIGGGLAMASPAANLLIDQMRQRNAANQQPRP